MKHTIKVYSATNSIIVKFIFQTDTALCVIDVTKYSTDYTGAAALFPAAMDYVTGLVNEMRAWVQDCAADAEDLSNITNASAIAIMQYVEREYLGGIAALVKEYDGMVAV